MNAPLGTVVSLVVALALVAASAPSAAAETIYQAFDERFDDVRGKLADLDGAGFSAVQVSPPQKSPDKDIWWARYQPIDFRVLESRLGNEQDLKELIDAAHDRGMKVLVDVVLNHMADPKYVGGQLAYPEFSAQDFRYPNADRCIGNYNDRYQVTHFWLCDANAKLPDLDTGSSYVRGVHKRYLEKLLALGVDGFRIDAMKHIEASYFPDVLQVIPPGKFTYGEVIGETLNESNEYTGMVPVTDFHLLRTMIQAFSASGDLRYLTHPEGHGAALPGSVAVVFARNHDTAMHGSFFNFGDYTDAMLANAYAVGRGVGHVLVYRDDAYDHTTRAALAFRDTMRGRPTYVRPSSEVCDGQQACDPKQLLFIERGSKGLMIINKANAWLDLPRAVVPGLEEGCYRDLRYGTRIAVAKGGDGRKWISAWGSRARGGLNIGPRTALALVKDGTCP